ncbi:rifin [Plasmodium reichenowi]|uniref:Rifin n=1 Tax=Plasmodium reichenowi TaxID=5854 RepID=A0A060RMA9_PLARE|nr:rifin [Plasmodium reichenowi]
MKVHYINILLFVFPLNILVNTHKKQHITTHHTPKIRTTRLLCEGKLYAPYNYDNDPQMRAVMDNYNKQTQQRFHEYDERMIEKQKQCKDKYDKVIQKIILKDKLEKELMNKFATLHTDIQSDTIPTCICEKSLADKTEKFCLKCGTTMGGFFPGYCLVSGLWYAAWRHYVPIAVAKAGMDAGMNVIKETLKTLGAEKLIPEILKGISSINDFSNVTTFASSIQTQVMETCAAPSLPAGVNQAMGAQICMSVKSSTNPGSAAQQVVRGALNQIVAKAPQAANTQAGEVAANYASTTSSLTTGIPASILAIEIIILIMMIIYWILRYRRKKRMKKKLQYIKLLEE